MAEMVGNRRGSTESRAIATEVSIRPRSGFGFWPGTRRRILIDVGIDVGKELLDIDWLCSSQEGKHGLRWNELAPPNRPQLPDRDAIAGDDEVLTAIQRPHDLSALVAQLALGQFSGHRA